MTEKKYLKDISPKAPSSGLDLLEAAHQKRDEVAPIPEKAGSQTWAQVMGTLGKASSQPASQADVLTQARINQQWMLFWNSRGPRPTAGPYKPLDEEVNREEGKK
jgi:hypothetical protein